IRSIHLHRAHPTTEKEIIPASATKLNNRGEIKQRNIRNLKKLLTRRIIVSLKNHIMFLESQLYFLSL
ncbi:hypothetical protein ACJX0J_009472, partial [Zea mays]